MVRAKGSEGRHIIYDDEDNEIYTNLLNSSNPFKKLSITDLFTISLVKCKHLGIRTELGEEQLAESVNLQLMDLISII